MRTEIMGGNYYYYYHPNRSFSSVDSCFGLVGLPDRLDEEYDRMLERKCGRATPIGIKTKTARANDIETTTYHEARQRKEVIFLERQWMKWSDRISKQALHHQGIRKNPLTCGYLDTVRAYAQELLSLEFHLAGPQKIDFLSQKDGEDAIASILRANAIFAGSSWRIRRCVDLLNRHLNYAHQENSAQVVSNPTLRKSMQAERLAIEAEYGEFCKKTRTRFETLFEELKKEVVCMKQIVRSIDRSQDLSFLTQLKEDTSRGKSSKPQKLFPWLKHSTQTKTRQYEMSGALPVNSAQKTPKWVNNVKAQFQKIHLTNSLESEPIVTRSKIHYQALKAREKLGIGNNPEASKDT
ncbi:hypothetical protein GGS26DRAFT_604496 [Hypomontagnella submonticulosa]|nr:hypothetical protein GGS26DRAFT_604496 [Hypomontagnella submonticulosa]